jgi:hypothetical protein
VVLALVDPGQGAPIGQLAQQRLLLDTELSQCLRPPRCERRRRLRCGRGAQNFGRWRPRRRRRLLTRRARKALGTATQCTRRNDSLPPPLRHHHHHQAAPLLTNRSESGPVEAFPSISIFRGENRCDIGKSRSKWTAEDGNAWHTGAGGAVSIAAMSSSSSTRRLALTSSSPRSKRVRSTAPSHHVESLSRQALCSRKNARSNDDGAGRPPSTCYASEVCGNSRS